MWNSDSSDIPIYEIIHKYINILNKILPFVKHSQIIKHFSHVPSPHNNLKYFTVTVILILQMKK